MKKIAALMVLAGSAVAQADNYGPGAGGALVDSTGNNSLANAGVATFVLSASNGANPTIASFNSLTLRMSHTWAGDLLIQLTSPAGTTADVLVRPGVTTATGFGSSSDLLLANTYTFVESGGAAWPTGSAASVAGGTYNRFPRAAAPVVAADTGLGFGAFAGENLNGNWTLTIRDYAGGDTGVVETWSMDITSTPTPGAAALLGLGGLVAGRRRRA